MRYRFYGDTLQLIKYVLTVTEEGQDSIYTAVSGEEKVNLLEQYPNAVVTEVDNTGYEWLDGMIFTQEELRVGELDKAIELGETAYAARKDAENQKKINAMLMVEIAKLKAGAGNG